MLAKRDRKCSKMNFKDDVNIFELEQERRIQEEMHFVTRSKTDVLDQSDIDDLINKLNKRA